MGIERRTHLNKLTTPRAVQAYHAVHARERVLFHLHLHLLPQILRAFDAGRLQRRVHGRLQHGSTKHVHMGVAHMGEEQC